jgi:V8-like Glu-specific endopeptidase
MLLARREFVRGVLQVKAAISLLFFAFFAVVSASADEFDSLKRQIQEQEPQINALKKDGLLSEGSRGFVVGSDRLDLSQRELVQRENYLRQRMFSVLASRTGQSRDEVAAQFAAAAQRAPGARTPAPSPLRLQTPTLAPVSTPAPTQTPNPTPVSTPTQVPIQTQSPSPSQTSTRTPNSPSVQNPRVTNKLPPNDEPIGSDGRNLVTAEEQNSDPYRYIGRVTPSTNPKDSSRGTATLVGPRHILTAAHVILGARDTAKQRAKKSGRSDVTLYFTMPDGKGGEVQSKIVKSELDGGYNYIERKLGIPVKLMSFDLAICALEDELGANGFAHWTTFEDAMYGLPTFSAGYDADLGGATLPPPLFTKRGTTRPLYEYAYKGALVGMVGTWTVTGKPVDLIKGALGKGRPGFDARDVVSLAAGAYGGLAGHVVDKEGWASNIWIGEGASGSPIWICTDDRQPQVIGVQSFILPQKSVPVFGVHVSSGQAMGTRIRKGPAAAMIRNFIAKPP